MNKKKAIKVLSATAVAATAFVATTPASADAASTTQAQTLVQKAKDAGTVLKWAISMEGSADGTTRPWAQYNSAKDARDKAVAAVNTLPAAQKAKLLAELDESVNLHITRAMHYIDAITAGEKIKAKQALLDKQIEKGLINDDTEAAYHDLSTEIRKQAVLLDRVYGQTTRDAIRGQYKKSAEAVRDSVKFEITVKMELDLASEAFKANNQEEAEKHLAEATKYLKDVKNATMKATLVKTLDELEAQLTPAVKSVTAINAKEIVVEFTTALEEGTTEAQLKTAFALEGKTDASAELSDDRKTVVYTLDSAEATNAKLTIGALNTDKKKADNTAVQTEEYITIFSYEDVVKPEVAETEYNHTSATAADLTLKFSEAVSEIGTISVNGVQVSPKSSNAATGEVVLGDLEVGKTYTIDIVGAIDTAATPNRAEHITLSLTVPAKVVDSEVPTVSTTANGNKITLAFSEEVTKGAVTINGTAVEAADITTEDNKKFVIDVQKANSGAFFASNANFFTAEVVVKEFADKATTPNEMKEVKLNTTFTADNTAAALVKAEAKADGKLVLEFNEDVTASSLTGLTVKTIDGIVQTSGALTVTSAVNPTVDGKVVKNKLELTLDQGTQLTVGKNYVIELATAKVADIYGNKNDKAITLNVVRPKTAEEQAQPGKVVTTTINEEANVITVEFAGTDEKGMTDSAINPANYTIGGKALPANTDIKFVDNRNKVIIALPESFVSVNGSFTFTAANLVDAFGNTLAAGENTATLELTENIAPTVDATLAVNGSNVAVVNFSEAIKSTDIDADGTSFEGIVVKVNGTAAEFTPSVSNGDLVITLTNATSLTDKVTVEFKNAELTDAVGNQVKNGTASN